MARRGRARQGTAGMEIEMEGRMTETAEVANRKQFREDVLALVQDLGALCRFVWDHPAFPVPTLHEFAPVTYSVDAGSEDQFDRLSDVLAADGVVEHESHVTFRLVRRRFGRAELQLYYFPGGHPPVADATVGAVPVGEVSS